MLSGLRVLAVEQFGAGPFGTLHLADLGAKVIKIEHPEAGGDIARSIPPYATDGDSLYFQSFNRNKLSVGLDLKHPEGRAAFHELVKNVDAVFSSLRGDQPDALGLTYEHLSAINRKIVCCALTGYGTTSTRRSEPAYDYLMQAETGWMSLTGEPDGPPTKSGLSMVDFSAGLAAMVGLLSAVLHARESGEGCDVEVSLYDTAISMLNYVAIWTLNTEHEPERIPRSAHPSIVPSQVFETADGWIVVFCAKEKFWQLLAEGMGANDLLDDPRFADFSARLRHRSQLVHELEERFKRRRTDDWLSLLRGKVPCAPVNDLRTALESDFTAERAMITEVDHPTFGTTRETDTSIRTSRQPETRANTPGPSIGQDTESVLREIAGYDQATITRLRNSGAIA